MNRWFHFGGWFLRISRRNGWEVALMGYSFGLFCGEVCGGAGTFDSGCYHDDDRTAVIRGVHEAPTH